MARWLLSEINVAAPAAAANPAKLHRGKRSSHETHTRVTGTRFPRKALAGNTRQNLLNHQKISKQYRTYLARLVGEIREPPKKARPAPVTLKVGCDMIEKPT